MTLQDRIARASGMEDAPLEQEELFVTLRNQVNARLSSEAAKNLMGTNPQSAENEIRSLCRNLFQQPIWTNIPAARRQELVDQVVSSIFGFGPLSELLADESITEIMVNGPDVIYFERDGVIYPSAERFVDAEQLRALIDRIVGPLGRRVDESSPIVNARLEQGHRVNAVISPIAPYGPVLTIRKFAERTRQLKDLVQCGSVEPSVATLLQWMIRARKNIAVSGGTGSGKTTFLNALSYCISPGERVITIEDSLELRFPKEAHVVSLEARAKNAEGAGEVTIRDLVINALRMRPDRIVVGECRGAEALDMLQAMNTGHSGSLTTLHANEAAEVPQRLATMVRFASEIPISVAEQNIASALDVIVQLVRGADGFRYVSQVAGLEYDQERRCAVVQLFYEREGAAQEGVWNAYPSWVDRLVQMGHAEEEEVRAWKEALL